VLKANEAKKQTGDTLANEIEKTISIYVKIIEELIKKQVEKGKFSCKLKFAKEKYCCHKVIINSIIEKFGTNCYTIKTELEPNTNIILV
jgi:hypothetical protein